jgi:outer membrane protein OmpA-like peptidoglycan-associated protein
VALGVVATATFVLGYYFPLLRAYQTLSARYQQERSDAQSSAQSLAQAQAALKQEQAVRGKLEAQSKERDGTKKVDVERLAALRKALADKLDKSLKSGDASLLAGGAAGVSLTSKALFGTKKNELSASGKSLLCEIAKLSATDPLRVSVVLDPAHASGTGFAEALEPGSAVAQALNEKCSVASSRLTLGSRTDGASSAERIELELGRD